jgi:microcystin degradation protein MlrC
LRLAEHASRTILIADTSDNPGAGGSGDTTGILAELIRQEVPDAVLGFLFDPAAAQAAFQAGEGAFIELELGGRHGPDGVEPIRGRFEVLRCAEGAFPYTGAVAGGSMADLGRMALLRQAGVQIAVTSRNVQAYDAAPFERLGVQPAAHRILALKSTCHYRAVFEPLSEAVLTVVSPGAYNPDPAQYPYRRLRAGVRYGPGRTDAHGG